jgi:hypothetical protein
MIRLPAVPISGEVVVTAAAEVFGVPTRRIRASTFGSDEEMRARDACCWMLAMISDASEREQMRMLRRSSLGAFREAVARAEMRRETSMDYCLQTESLLAGMLAVGRLGIGRVLAGVDPLGEARAMLEDPIRAVKSAPAAVLAAIVEHVVEQGEILETVRMWLLLRDRIRPGGDDVDAPVERELAASVRDLLGLPGEAEGPAP